MLAALWLSGSLVPTLRGDEIATLRQEAAAEGWTFTVGDTSVSEIPLEVLCGLSEPEGVRNDARRSGLPGRDDLPGAFDWRAVSGCPPIRDQGWCGSCWAFATVGPLECNILIQDGDVVDLSEQWLVRCNREGYSCAGGWWAHHYHLNTPDPCGQSGAVLEEDLPYTASDGTCGCPHPHHYVLDDWDYVDPGISAPSVAAIKQAIYEYGPVAAAVRVTSAFHHYTGGVFNAPATGSVNHGVVLVGWDDDQGENGIWILRNSWGTGWGEDGYMRIAYGAARIGYAASYVVYRGGTGCTLDVTPASRDFGEVLTGTTATGTVIIENIGEEECTAAIADLAAPFSFIGPAELTLAPGAQREVVVEFTPTVQGDFSAVLRIDGGGRHEITLTGRATGAGPSDTCVAAPFIADGTFEGDSSGAGTSTAATCAASTHDVWWHFVAPAAGLAVFDTSGSNFDTVLSLYDGCSGGEIACNDDCGLSDVSSCLARNVLAGQRYLVRVAGKDGASGLVHLNIATTTPAQTISGRILDSEDRPVAGVTLAGLPGDPVTDDAGYYAAPVPYGFSGTAEPRKTAYTFGPNRRDYDHVITDIPDQDYTAVPPLFEISGTLRNQLDRPVVGAVLEGLPGRPVTQANGSYTAHVPLGFAGDVVPAKTGAIFTPAQRTYTHINADLRNEDYVATEPLGSLVVSLEPAAACEAGAAWRLVGGNWRAPDERVEQLPAGMYQLEFADVSGWTRPLREDVMVVADRVTHLTRTYARHRYRLHLVTEPDVGGTLITDAPSDESGRFPQDTLVHLQAIPAPGFEVVQWIGADARPATAQRENTVTMTGERMVTVQFGPAPLTLVRLLCTVAAGEGWIAPQSRRFSRGAIVELTATPAPGYAISHWEGTDDDSSRSPGNTVTLHAATIVSVHFAPKDDCNGNGIADAVDLAEQTSMDCNANGTPDDCEPDSDGDGIPDACDKDVQRAGEDADAPRPGLTAGLCGAGLLPALALSGLGLGLPGLRHRPRRPERGTASLQRL